MNLLRRLREAINECFLFKQEPPERCPYGFWIDKDGRYCAVDQYQHDAAAKFHMPEGSKNEVPSTWAFEQGWVRIVRGMDELLWSAPNGFNSRVQQTAAKDLAAMYRKQLVRDSWNGYMGGAGAVRLRR